MDNQRKVTPNGYNHVRQDSRDISPRNYASTTKLINYTPGAEITSDWQPEPGHEDPGELDKTQNMDLDPNGSLIDQTQLNLAAHRRQTVDPKLITQTMGILKLGTNQSVVADILKSPTLHIPKMAGAMSNNKFKAAVEKVQKINRTKKIMDQILKEQEMVDKEQENKGGQQVSIFDQVTEERELSIHHKKSTLMPEDFDDEFEDFKQRRMEWLPELPHIELHGHGHGHGHGSAETTRFIIRQNSSFKFWWDVWILVLAIIICFMLPVYIAYHPPFGTTTWWHVLEYSIEGFFSLDVIFHFNTTLYDHDGNEVFDRKHIAIHYVSELHFWIDLFATIPLGSSPVAKLLPCMKVIRITSLSNIIKKLSIKDETKAMIKAIQLVFYLILYIHMKACIWFFVCNSNQRWLPPIYWKWPVDLEAEETRFFDSTNYTEQYLISVYYSVLMLKPNEIGPRSNVDLLICTIIMVLDLIVAANVYGSVAVLVQMAGRRSAKFQKQIDNANSAMQDMQIKRDVQQQVREFLVLIQATREQQEELQKFYEMISPSLKKKVAIYIYSDIFTKNTSMKKVVKDKLRDMMNSSTKIAKKLTQKQFKDKVIEKLISHIVTQFTTQLNTPEDVIIHEYDESTDMYFVAKGECIVNIRDENNKIVKNHKILTISEYFGEISMLYGCRRTATVVSRKYTMLAKLTRSQFKEITTEYPHMTDQLKKGVFAYNDKMKNFIKQNLKKLEFLQDVSDDAMHDFLYGMTLRNYSEGDILQKPGDIGTTLYFVQDGVVEVSRDFDGHAFVIERLFRGSIINYRTWFMENNAEVFLKCEKNCIIQELSLQTMNNICKKHKDMEGKFLKFQKKIFQELKFYPLDYIMNLPPEHMNKELSLQKQILAWKLENIQKNIVMRRVLEIKAEKSKPGLKEAIQITLQKKAERDEKVRLKLKKKIMDLYEKEISASMNEEDRQYTRIVLQIDRLHKILNSQSQQVIQLEKRILKQPQRSITSYSNSAKGRNNTMGGGMKYDSILSDAGSRETLQQVRMQPPEDTYKPFFQTQKMEQFMRVEDDKLSVSSEEEEGGNVRGQIDHLNEITKIAIRRDDFTLSLDYKEQHNSPEKTLMRTEVIDISDESSDGDEAEERDKLKKE